MSDSVIQDLSALIVAASSVAAATVAVIALRIAQAQIQANNDISVQDAYLDYHHLCIQHPQFAMPDYAKIARDPLEHERYYWFVLSMLICIERVLQTYKDVSGWERAILDDFEIHAEFICGPRFEPVIQNFDPMLQKRLLKFRAEYCAPSRKAVRTARRRPLKAAA